jgi:mannose-1-phosphate guanylyltransferase
MYFVKYLCYLTKCVTLFYEDKENFIEFKCLKNKKSAVKPDSIRIIIKTINNMSNTYVVIMAGGSGTRFWPFSRVEKPKQFLDVLGIGQSLLQMTFDRFKEITDVANIYVVTNSKYKSLVTEQLPEMNEDQILLEPFQRNTAACIAYACYKIGQDNPDANIVVSPSDHIIFKESVFTKIINQALELSGTANNLVTIGVKPNRPETGYGYIQYVEDRQSKIKRVKTFTEKPAKELAAKFIESGDFVWNAGIFVWSVAAIKSAFAEFLPEMDETFNSIAKDFYSENEQASVDTAYAQCKNISIDYGIMEKARNVYVVLGDFGWSDLGSWRSLYEVSDKDENNNMVKANVILYDTKNCTISGPKKKLIVVSGIDNCLITQHGNAILICNKESNTELKTIVHDIQTSKLSKFL